MFHILGAMVMGMVMVVAMVVVVEGGKTFETSASPCERIKIPSAVSTEEELRK